MDAEAARPPGEDEPEPFAQLGGLDLAVPSEEQPDEVDKAVEEQIAVASEPEEPARDGSAESSREDAEVALKAAAELAKPAAEAAKAAAEEAMAEEDRQAEAPQLSSSEVTPPENHPPPLGTQDDAGPQAPPLPPPAFSPEVPEPEEPLNPGERVILPGRKRGEGVVQECHADESVTVRLLATQELVQVPRQAVEPLKVPLPAHAVALPVQDEDVPAGRTSLHSTGRNSEVDTLHSLHIHPGSIFGRALLAYTTQVAKRPNRLLCFYTLAVLVPLVVGIIFRGFALETDFNAFIKADGSAMRDREAFQLAFEAKKDLNGRRLQEEVPARRLYQVDGDWVEEEPPLPRRLGENVSAPGRRLKTLFLRREYQLLYRAKGGNILDEKALQDIQAIEAGLRNLPGLRDLCETKITGATKRFLCDPGISIVATAFPTQVASSRGNIFLELVWNGLGRDVLPPEAITAYMKTSYERERQESRLSRRFFPKTYQYPEIGMQAVSDPEAARSKFSFHLTLGQNGDPVAQINANIGKVKAMWQEVMANELLPYFLETQKRANPQVDLFWSSPDIDSIEINGTLFNDLLMAIGSILFVVLYLRIHTGTWTVSIASFLIIFISVPLAYIMTPAAKATIASFLSVFLITGIGCDVVFVFTDFWEQGHKLPLESRCMWMIVHAGESCLATSMTTALSFFANLASALQPLREFGMFMGLCVMCAFFLVLLMMPPLLVAVEQSKESVKLRVVDISSGQAAALEDEKEEGKKKKKKDGLMQGLLFTLMSGIGSCPCVIMLGTVAFFLTAAIGVVVTAQLSTGVPDIFPEWHNQVASKTVLDLFSTESNLESVAPASSLLCRAHTMNGTSIDGCSLHWCEAMSTWSATTTTTTIGSGRQVSCRRSPVLKLDDAGHKQGVDDTYSQACSEISVFARVALDTVAQGDWTRTMTAALDDALSPTGYSSTSFSVSQLRPLVIENWETGEVQVSEFWQSQSITAEGPFQQVEANPNDTVACEMHMLCFEENRYVCGEAGWKTMASYSYGSRRLNIVGTLVTQTVASAIDVSVLWGIRSARYTPLVGPPAEFWSFDPTFQPQNPWAQRAIRNMCTGIPASLRVWRAKCWIHDFSNFLTQRNRRFPSRAFDEDIIDWYYADTVQAQAHLWFEDRKVIATKLQFFVNIGNLADASEGLAFMNLWEVFVQAKNRQASITANAAWHTASLYVRAEAERAIIGSTIDTIIIATCSGWAGVFLFTFDVWLAVIVTSVVIVVITGLAFFISCIMAWSIGPIEVISLVVFVGYSVTYALHIAHNYNQMREDDKDLRTAEVKARKRQAERRKAKAARLRERGDVEDRQAAEAVAQEEALEITEEDLTFTSQELREARTRVAVLHVGGATLSSALSTAGSSAFLLFCTLTIFVKLGAVVVAVTVLSILAAIVTLPAALILAGPAPDAWYKRKARHLLRMLRGKDAEQESDFPLLEDEDSVKH